jgi:hypothetical protein
MGCQPHELPIADWIQQGAGRWMKSRKSESAIGNSLLLPAPSPEWGDLDHAIYETNCLFHE